MATSSTDDVFIDFSGIETRNSFVTHLLAAFRRRSVSVRLGGDCTNVATQPKTYEGCKVFVVVFSENYAFSKQCLDTLSEFLERKDDGLVIVPVYYGGVTESMVKQQTDRFGVAFSQHGNKYLNDRVAKWRDCLTKTAGLPGHELNLQQEDSEFVEKIVADVREELDATGKIGVYSRLLEIEKLLCTQCHKFYHLGLWGMPGIGKTTIAEAAFKQMSKDFEASFFVEEFYKEYRKGRPYKQREEYLKKVLKGGSSKEPTLSFETLRKKKVLFVLDDVRNLMDFESFLGDVEGVSPGSVIILTSRDKQVLYQCQVEDVFEVPSLNEKEAIRLFSRTMFLQEWPSDVKLMDVSKKIVKYAGGNPKALCLYGRELEEKKKPEEMEAEFEKMKKCPPQEILSLFRSSYDALNDNERSIFMDIACFFNGEPSDNVMRILEGCGFFPHVGIDRLAERSLLSISKEKKVEMQNFIQDAAREFVNQTSRRRRLWEPSRIRLLLENDNSKGNEVIEGIFLDTTNVVTFDVNHKAFENMYNLRLLKIYSPNSETAQELRLPKEFHSLPYELRLLHWEKCPMRSLPVEFDPRHLVELNMPYSQLQSLSVGTKSLAKLRMINLSHSQKLLEVDELAKACNLEKIDLQAVVSPESTTCSMTSSRTYIRTRKLLSSKSTNRLTSHPRILHKAKGRVSFTHQLLGRAQTPSSTTEVLRPSICTYHFIPALVEVGQFLNLSGCTNIQEMQMITYTLFLENEFGRPSNSESSIA
ncbi:PREDICTED: probable WRKY transcription factor 16 [Camelina sativa]|uniref:Probable WRKY transcription factor 16 n=1 Tax=Camelina sativa TaxID=90675 RepID=A0ABM0Y573_CAMSA|nr:PREDICTED: probable WRKY transcription factor 16 [Camelina sativa]